MKFIIIKKTYMIVFLISCIVMYLFIFSFFYKIFSTSTSLSTSAFEDKTFEDKISNLMNQEEKIAYLTFDDGPTFFPIQPKNL